MKLVFSCCTLTLAAALGCAKAESQTGVTLDARLPGSYGAVSNVVELKDGRVAFADTKDKLFLAGDLKSGKVDTLGSRVDSLKPEGPVDQYKFPGWVAHLAGDTVALVDFSVLRTTVWNEKGKPLGVLPILSVAGETPVLVYDSVGHGYKIDYQAMFGRGSPGRMLQTDSIPVLRIRLKSGKVDTVAMLTGPEFGDATFGEQVQRAAKVFAPNDHFGVMGDGTAWVARGHQNRVDWRAPDGTWTQGKAREYPKVTVTQADKERVLAQVREQGKQFGMPQELKIVYPFAETKPPFDFALGRPNGEVWLQRPRNEEDAPLVYDVVDRRGEWRRAVTFPKGATLAGFGASDAVYAAIRGKDGKRTVGRFQVR